MSYYIKCIKNYVNFNGRARRREYWFFYLFNMIIGAALALLVQVDYIVFGIIAGIYGLFILLPALAVLVRRLHDTGKSGAWIFISLVPFVGSIWLLILLCTDSDLNDNMYGPNPKTEEVQ